MSFPAPIGRFVLRPRTAWPPDYILPAEWQDWEGGPFPAGAYVIWTAPYELRKLQIVFSRIAAAGFQTDPAVTTCHFMNLTGGNPDDTWVDADFLAVEAAFLDSFWASVKVHYPTGIVVDQLRWYKDGPAFHPTPEAGNPAVRVVEHNVPGTAAFNPCPPQVAVSATEKTALRKRWGRMYWPNPATNAVGPNGNMTSTFQAAISAGMENWFETCVNAGLHPVVFSPTNESAYQVESVQVDDLFDVIRSRRWKQPTSRLVTPIDQS